MQEDNYKFGTKAIHAGVEPDPTTGAIMTPIYQTSTFRQERVGQHQGYAYSRTSNPTRSALESALAELENGKYGACFGSGVAAIDAVLKMLNPGDEVITTDDLYGGSYRLFSSVYERFGIKFHYIDINNLALLDKTINNNTKLIWIETPTNPLMNIIDIRAITKHVEDTKIKVAVDNTFATPYLQTPIDLGADIVMHSATKYLGGHSDVVMGALVTNNKSTADQIYHLQKTTGGVPGPMDAFLVLRGLKTLHLRMQRHCENGEILAHFLKDHPKVDKVYWPGFKNHPNHEIAKNQMRDFGGMISFSLKENSLKETYRVMERFKVFTLAESLGGVESLICHPATMTNAAIPEKKRQEIGIVDSLIRLSVGVEDVEDLMNDLKQTLT